MAIIGFKAQEREQQEFSYKEGLFEARLSAFEEKTSSTSNSPYYKLTFHGEDFNVISLNLSDNYFGRHLLYRLFIALDIDPERTDVDDSELVDTYMKIKIAKRKNKDGTDYLYNDKPQFQVVDIETADTVEDDDDDSDNAWVD